jgi:hypothetical protein
VSQAERSEGAQCPSPRSAAGKRSGAERGRIVPEPAQRSVIIKKKGGCKMLDHKSIMCIAEFFSESLQEESEEHLQDKAKEFKNLSMQLYKLKCIDLLQYDLLIRRIERHSGQRSNGQ